MTDDEAYEKHAQATRDQQEGSQERQIVDRREGDEYHQDKSGQACEATGTATPLSTTSNGVANVKEPPTGSKNKIEEVILTIKAVENTSFEDLNAKTWEVLRRALVHAGRDIQEAVEKEVKRRDGERSRDQGQLVSGISSPPTGPALLRG